MIEALLEYLPPHWAALMVWLSQPHILAVVLWAITFTSVITIGLGLGFGSKGIVAGSLAAAFQSYVYGGFVPAGGIFAMLTGIAMLGILVPRVTLFASVVATIVAGLVWAAGVGR